MTPKSTYRCLWEHFVVMLLLDNNFIMACILKQLGSELLTNPWDGLASLKIEWFSIMTCDMIEFLRVKLPCNFGG
jgi:hypothetical protein